MKNFYWNSMNLHQYQAAMTIGHGKEIMGLLNISFGKNRATVKFEVPGERPKRIASFSKTKWLDQENVNTELRARGILWHRSVSEAEYAKA